MKLKAWIAKLNEPPSQASVECAPQKDCEFKIGNDFEVYLKFEREGLYTVRTIAYALPTNGQDCCSFKNGQNKALLDIKRRLNYYELYFDRLENLSLRPANKFGKLYISIEK